MPFPAILSAIGGQIASTAIQSGAQGILNTGEYRRNLQGYQMQRRDALADWQRDAAYNDPSAQLDRMKKAGINPHFSGGQSFVTSSPQTRGASLPAAPKAYQINSATNNLQMQQGLEQLKLMRLQQARTEADT